MDGSSYKHHEDDDYYAREWERRGRRYRYGVIEERIESALTDPMGLSYKTRHEMDW